MTNPVTAVKAWWLTPAPALARDRKAARGRLPRPAKNYAAVTLLIGFLGWDAPVVLGVWLLVAFGHAVYQYPYAFAGSMDRPSYYEETTAMFLVLDVVNHIAVAGFSRIGWWALGPVALAWYLMGQAVGQLASRKELKKTFALISADYPDEPRDERIQMTRAIVQERLGAEAE